MNLYEIEIGGRSAGRKPWSKIIQLPGLSRHEVIQSLYSNMARAKIIGWHIISISKIKPERIGVR